ncbi:MAG: methyltransferase domain-containing protein [Cyanobacteria bacterium J06642_2]
MTETATAHRAWNERWQTSDGRADWLVPDLDVLDTIPLLQKRSVRQVLDLGCGVGCHAIALAKAGFETCGMDGSESGLDFVRQAVSGAVFAIQFAFGAMTDLPYDDASFDFVLAFNVIYYGDPEMVDRAIAETRRVSNPKGLFQATMLS